MLDRYAKLVSEINKYKNECKLKKAKLDINDSKRKALNSQRTALLSDREEEIRQEINQHINIQISQQEAPLKAKLENLKRVRDRTSAKKESDYETLRIANYNVKEAESFELTNACEDLLDRVEPLFKPYIEESLLNGIAEIADQITINDSVLRHLYAQVERNAYSNAFSTEMPKLISSAVGMFMPDKLKSKSSSMQVLELFSKGIVLMAGLAIAAPVVIVPYCVSLLRGSIVQVENANRIQKLLYYYELLRACTYKHKVRLLQRCEELRQQDLSEISQYYTNKINSVEQKIESIEYDINQIPNNVRNSFDSDIVSKKLERQYDNKSAEFDMQEQQLRVSYEKMNTELKALTEKVNMLELERSELQKTIKDTMLSLTSFREDPMLLTKFFLGFDDNDNIMTVDYEGKPTFIVYTGDDSNAVTQFIDMILIQFYTNMLINNIKIDIIDLVNAGIAYDVFRHGSLSDVVNVISTTEEESTLIDTLSKEMRTRSSSLSGQASSIHDYNQLMLSKKSIPMEYRVIILQTYSKSLLQNEKFIPLCNAAEKVGIIPIIFANSEDVPGLARGGKKNWNEQELQAWIDLITAIPGKFYHYNADSEEVSPLEEDYKKQTLSYLNNALNKLRQ